MRSLQRSQLDPKVSSGFSENDEINFLKYVSYGEGKIFSRILFSCSPKQEWIVVLKSLANFWHYPSERTGIVSSVRMEDARHCCRWYQPLLQSPVCGGTDFHFVGHGSVVTSASVGP